MPFEIDSPVRIICPFNTLNGKAGVISSLERNYNFRENAYGIQMFERYETPTFGCDNLIFFESEIELLSKEEFLVYQVLSL